MGEATGEATGDLPPTLEPISPAIVNKGAPEPISPAVLSKRFSERSSLGRFWVLESDEEDD
jgi:hypothetical protein